MWSDEETLAALQRGDERAITRAQREGRAVPFSALGDDGEGEPAVDPDRFRPESDRWAGDVEATAPDDLLAVFRSWRRGVPVPDP